MRSTFKILFYINRQKIKADGKTAILCRITIDGKSIAWKSHTNLTHPGKYFRPSKVKIMRPTSPK